MKKITATLGILALAALIAAPALAQGPGYGKGRGMMGMMGRGPVDPALCPRYGWGYGEMTDEQRSQMAELQGLRQKHFDETAEIRSQMWAKQGELRILMATSDPDFERARALQKEISDLRAKMAQERINLYEEAGKINPDLRFGRAWGRGKGFGPGTEGYGPGMGRSWKRGGYGMGPRWN